MKTCPNCNEQWIEDFDCCPYCGADLPDTVDLPYHPTNIDSIPHGDHTFTPGVHSDEDKSSTVKIGDGNIFTGGVHTTINEAQKSKSELQERDLEAFRQECKKQYKNGLISKEGEDILNELQRRYALSDELVLPIKEEVKKQSRKPITQLPLAVLSGIRQTKSFIEQNSPTALNRQLQQLDSWMKEYEDDALKAYYFQLSSMLEPTRYTERYEESAKNEYWEVFWAYIAYLLQNKEKQAFDAQASLGRLQSAYPELNEVLLRLVGRLMQDDPIEDIKQGYNVRALNCSQELKLLLDTVDELLQKDWSAEPPIKIREVHSFYADTLFKSFVDTQKADGEKKRKALEYISRIDREKQIELQRKKGFLLQKFGEVENIEKACQVLGISDLTLQDWLKDDSSFNSSYYDIVRRIEDKKAEEDKKARIAKELEERIKQQKSEFKSKYEQNGCDFSKTCSDLNIDRDTVRIWRGNDKAFEDGLSFIEREHEKKLQEIFVQFYDSNGCDLQKACAEAGISVERVNRWRESDKGFDGVISTIENEHVQAIKETFVECYKNNDCNLLKTCSETGLDSSTYRDWLNTDHAFADKIKYIENVINKKRKKEEDRIRKERCKKRWNRFKKTYLPIVLSTVLLAAICIKIIPIISKGIENKRAQKAAEKAAIIEETNRIEGLRDQYSILVSEFNSACIEVGNSDNKLDPLKRVINLLNEVKAFELKNPGVVDSEYEVLKKKASDLCEYVDSVYTSQYISTPSSYNKSQSQKAKEFLDAVEELQKQLK